MRHALEGVQAGIYSLEYQREPLDQTDLKNGGDAILKAMDNQHNNEADR